MLPSSVSRTNYYETVRVLQTEVSTKRHRWYTNYSEVHNIDHRYITIDSHNLIRGANHRSSTTGPNRVILWCILHYIVVVSWCRNCYVSNSKVGLWCFFGKSVFTVRRICTWTHRLWYSLHVWRVYCNVRLGLSLSAKTTPGSHQHVFVTAVVYEIKIYSVSSYSLWVLYKFIYML